MSFREKSKVLVLGDTLSALAVARSLGKRDVVVVAGIEDFSAPLRYSRYTSGVFHLPSYPSDPEVWRECVKSMLLKERPDMVIPASESAFVPFCLNRDYFSNFANMAIPDKDGFENTFFKDKTMALAEELGIPIPKSFIVRGPEDLEKFLHYAPFNPPFVVKPIVSKTWKDGYKLEFSATQADSTAQVKNYVNNYLSFAPILVQPWVWGVGAGQEFLCRDGEILLAFEHQRIHEPQGSGGSSLRKSVPLDARMLEHSKKILKRLKWTGVAMVEYRKNLATGEFVLLEINGRFWGSLPLALEAGADFPRALFELSLADNAISGSRTSPGKSDFPAYKTGVYCRDLLDDLRFIAKSRGIPEAILSLGLAKIRFLLGLEKWDAFIWSDPLPGLMEFWFAFRSIFSAATNRLSGILSRVFYRKPAREEIKNILQKNRSILFVCFGNIARSPFAKNYFEKKLKENGISDVKVNSAGLYPKENRLAHPYARLAAKDFGVDLSEHRSAILNDEAARSCGAIFCMDFKEYRMIKKMFPEAGPKLFLLGGFCHTNNIEINDPWGGDPETYRNSYRVIKDNINKLFSLKLIS